MPISSFGDFERVLDGRGTVSRTVIRIHLAEGNVAEAEQAYRQCCVVLAREFGMAPSAQTSVLVPHLRRSRRPEQGVLADHDAG